MTMHKTGSTGKIMGKEATPWPSKVLIHSAKEGCFVPQPQVTDNLCPKCGGTMIKSASGKETCQAQCSPEVGK